MRIAMRSLGFVLALVLVFLIGSTQQILSLKHSTDRLAPPAALAQGASRPTAPTPQVPQESFSGEVVYWIHAGKAGRIFGLAGATTSSTTLILMPADMNTVIRPQTPVRVELKLCLEAAVAGSKVPAGIQARINGVPMAPFVSGTSFVAGYVFNPNLGAVGAFSTLESWCFDWEKSVPAGLKTIQFFWAVASAAGRVWGDFYAISVWATKVKP